jgi:putative oxidoreductase
MNRSNLHSCGNAILRIVVGVIFVMHGWQKLSWGFHNVAGFLGSLNIPLPTLAAVVLTIVELLGGVSLIIGILTRFAAALLSIDMLVAIIVYHAKNGFFGPKGIEFPMLLLAANLDLLLSGAGSLSLSALRKKKTTPASTNSGVS